VPYDLFFVFRHIIYIFDFVTFNTPSNVQLPSELANISFEDGPDVVQAAGFDASGAVVLLEV
jgi:hypothetical protein